MLGPSLASPPFELLAAACTASAQPRVFVVLALQSTFYTSTFSCKCLNEKSL